MDSLPIQLYLVDAFQYGASALSAAAVRAVLHILVFLSDGELHSSTERIVISPGLSLHRGFRLSTLR